MPPVDKTPAVYTGNFELCYSLQAFDRIPVSEYISRKTGLTVCIAQVDGPIVNGYFCLGTEAFDDDGLPHTLEHLIFLGSETYPYKGVLDLLANRCLASGTNAWTDIDHTCYTMETAGSEGFCSLMPIFLDHILYPILSDEGFITEVHHITGEGEDAGVVYCEMQGVESSATFRMHREISRNIYPGKCGYSSETGGLMKNLRESTTNDKVRAYHKEFYRPENLKIIITGQIKPEEVFKALEPLEQKIIAKGDRGPFERPWQSAVPPLETSKCLEIRYPSDDEDNGLYAMAWRGPSAVRDLYSVTACSIMLKYLTENAASPLRRVFVENDDPYASNVSYNLYENAETCLYVVFEDVPLSKVDKVGAKLQEVLRRILNRNEIDMERMRSIINKFKLENICNIENSPHRTVTFMIIGHMLYGNTKNDLEQRVNPLKDLEHLAMQPINFWLNILHMYLTENNFLSIECYPSKEEQKKMAKEEKERIEKQREDLGEDGLKLKKIQLDNAIEFNEREPPNEMLTSVPIPSLHSIKFHEIQRYRTDDSKQGKVDLSETSVFTYLDDVKTSFVYLNALLDTKEVPLNLRIYLPLLLESWLVLPLERNGYLVPYDQVVAELNDDTIEHGARLGLGGDLFSCGSYSQTAIVYFQAETSKYRKSVNWLREILYQTKFDSERIKVVALKMSNTISQCKRRGGSVASYAMKNLWYSKESNVYFNGMMLQSKFLSEVIQKLNGKSAHEVLNNLERLRKILTDPANLIVYLAGNLNTIEDIATPLKEFLPPSLKQPLIATPDHLLLNSGRDMQGCIIGLGSIESAFYYQSVQSLTSYESPDLPALMLYLQYLKQAEGPMWKRIRGQGYAYNYNIIINVQMGILYLMFGRATNVVGAYEETKEIFEKQLITKEWDETLLESAKSSLVFVIIEKEKTIDAVTSWSLSSYFQGVDFNYNRKLLEALDKVTVEDLNRVGKEYIAPLFDTSRAKVALVIDPKKLEDSAESFKKFGLNFTVYPSLEESFLCS